MARMQKAWVAILVVAVSGVAGAAALPSAAIAEGKCDGKAKPCPLQQWMRDNVGTPMASGELSRIAEGQGLKKDRGDDAEDAGVGSDAERERQDEAGAEHGTASKEAKAVAEVGEEGGHVSTRILTFQGLGSLVWIGLLACPCGQRSPFPWTPPGAAAGPG